jgi:uncharacterized protein (DUF427 family)
MTQDREQEKTYRRGVKRELPTNIVIPGPGRESVWDYPRPPVVEPVSARLRVEFAGITLAETTNGMRLLETSNPPVYYFPVDDVRTEFLTLMAHHTLCEWEGGASYWTVSVRGREQEAVAWSYEEPDEGFQVLRGRFAFYAGRVDACFAGDERVIPQPGDYYGGWVTKNIVGPFKGELGSERW